MPPTDPAVNPFYNWNVVELMYCDGGSFSGERASPLITADGTQLHFRGAAILRAYQDALLGAEYGLGLATDVVVGGCSAGALAALMQCDRWANRLAAAQSDGVVKVQPISSPLPPSSPSPLAAA